MTITKTVKVKTGTRRDAHEEWWAELDGCFEGNFGTGSSEMEAVKDLSANLNSKGWYFSLTLD